jgi:hypothetical protein
MSNQMTTIRNVLLCILVFFVAFLLPGLVLPIVTAVLLYLLLQYREKLRALERGRESKDEGQRGPQPSSEP